MMLALLDVLSVWRMKIEDSLMIWLVGFVWRFDVRWDWIMYVLRKEDLVRGCGREGWTVHAH